jgi:M6 family metalloprotease-like protein
MSKALFKSVQIIGTSVLLSITLSTAIAQTTFTERGILKTFHYDSPSPNIPIKEMVSIKTNTGKIIQFEAEEFTKKSSINLEHLTNKEVDIKYSINTTTPRSTLNKSPVKPTLLDIKAAPSTREATVNTTDWYNEVIYGTKIFHTLLCKYSDSPTDPNDIKENNRVINSKLVKQEFGKLRQYWKLNSQGKYNITGSVFGWYTLPFTKYEYDYLTNANARDFNTDCMNAALKDGFNLTPTYGVIFIAEDPKFIAYTIRNTLFPGKNTDGLYGPNRDGSWPKWIKKSAEMRLSTAALQTNTIAHEMGHAIGLYHSYHDYDKNNIRISNEYGNAWDVVSQQWALNYDPDPQYTLGYNRFKLGWLNKSQIFNYQLKNAPQTVVLETASLLQKINKRIIILNHPVNKSILYSVEVRGVKNAGINLDTKQQAINLDKRLIEPVVIIHQHTIDSLIGVKSTVVNPGNNKTTDHSFTESVMLKQSESWTAPMVAPIDKAMFKITVDQVTDTGATVTVSTVTP